MKSKFTATVLGLFFLLGAVLPQGVLGDSDSGLDRIVQQLEQEFPVLEGVVLAVDGDTLTLDLKQGQSIQPGDLLTLIRFGEEIIHPVTQKVVGRQETDLGEIRVTEVRPDYSLARALAFSPENQPQRGDGVRSVFKKWSILVAPIQSEAGSKVDTELLKLEMGAHISASTRFQVPDFDLQLWMLESGLKMKSLTDLHHLTQLKSQVDVNAILVVKVLNVQGQTALSYKVIATNTGEVVKSARLLAPNLGSAATVRQKERGKVQTSFESTKNGMLTFVNKHEFDFEVVDFATGDLTGNGSEEFVFIDSHRIMIYHYQNQKFKKIGQVTLRKNINRFFSVDVADINGNGRDEIFVTNQKGDQLGSFVLEVVPGKKGLQEIWQDVNLYLRVIRSFDRAPRLIGQRPGFDRPFGPGIFPIKYINGSYQLGPKLELEPSRTQFMVYGFTRGDISSQPSQETIILDKNYKLRVYSLGGRALVKSDDYFGHDPRIIDVGVKDVIPGAFNSMGDPQPVNFRGRLELIKHGSKKFLVVPRNHHAGGSILSNLVVINNSNLAFFGITREGLERVFETKKQKGYLAGYQVVDLPDSQSKQVHAVIVSNAGGILSKKKISTVFTYDW